MTDLVYALSPIYFFGNLNMDLKKRIILIGLTGSGLLYAPLTPFFPIASDIR